MAPPRTDAAPLHRSAVKAQATLRDRFFHRLPLYTDPYNVGYMDIEVPARDPRPVSNLRRDGTPVLRLDTVLMGISYPCDLCKGFRSPDDAETPPGRLNAEAASCNCQGLKGYAKYLNISALPVTPYLACTSLSTKSPAFRNAKLAAHWPEDVRKDPGPTGQKVQRRRGRYFGHFPWAGFGRRRSMDSSPSTTAVE